MDAKPRVGVVVQSEPGSPPKYLHTHSITVILGIAMPADDEETLRRIQEVFADAAFSKRLQDDVRDVVQSVGARVATTLIQNALEGRDVVYESDLRRFMTKAPPSEAPAS